MWRGSREGPGPTCVREAARRGASISRRDPRLGCSALGQGLAAAPHLWRDPQKRWGETARQGAPRTTGRRYRLSRKVSVSRGESAREPGGCRGAVGSLRFQSQARAGGSQPSPARTPTPGSPDRGESACVSFSTGDTPLSREPPIQSPRPPPGLGIPSPSAQIPARPLPTLPGRESGGAGDKETPASCAPGPSARPRHSPATSRVDTPEKGGGQGGRPAGGCPGDTPPAAPQTVPGPKAPPPWPQAPAT